MSPSPYKIVSDVTLLRMKSFPWLETKAELCNLFEQMTKALIYSPIKGVALSAIQIGIPARVMIIHTKELVGRFIHPRIISKSDPFIFNGEGCLCFPGHYISTQRYRAVDVEWTDLDGKQHTQIFKDMLAVIFQHEIDHMDGYLFMDRIYKPQPITNPNKWGRNEPCYCKSGKKFKKCHGK